MVPTGDYGWKAISSADADTKKRHLAHTLLQIVSFLRHFWRKDRFIYSSRKTSGSCLQNQSHVLVENHCVDQNSNAGRCGG